MKINRGLLSLSPLAVFVASYLATSIIAHDFYKMPITVAFLISSVYAVAISRGGKLTERVATFSRGAGTEGIMTMIWIFVLAGAFASAAGAMGAVEATVNTMLHILPENMLVPGLFLASCFISLSIGTSVGTIVALVPIAHLLACQTGIDVAMTAAVVVGGAFFGDNLSFISDTTIVATTTQGCRMDDKFRANIFIALPATIVVLVAYFFIGAGATTPQTLPDIDILKIIPYLAVFVTALMGMNVMLVLTAGIVLTGIIGIAGGSYDFFGWAEAAGKGITGMGELIIITMLAGGLFETIRHGGGIAYIIKAATRHIHGRRGAELTVGFLVAFVDVCTANNTVAIITVGDIARQISRRFGIEPQRTASLLDTCSCIMQCIIPYGVQVLMAAQLAGITPFEIIPHLYYAFALAVMVLISILFRWNPGIRRAA